MVGIIAEVPKTFRAKVIVVGDSGVGKTSLIESCCTDGTNFSKSYNMTIGVEIKSKTFNLPQTANSVEFLFLDSSGSELYENFNKKCWTQNCLICLVYDVTNKKTLENLNKWYDMVKSFGQKNVSGILIANKIDLVNRRFVTETTGRDFAQKLKMQYFECSSKENNGIQDAFMSLGAEIVRLAK